MTDKTKELEEPKCWYCRNEYSFGDKLEGLSICRKCLRVYNKGKKELIEEVKKMIDIIKNRNRFETFTKKWIDLEQELQKLKEKNGLG